ncbi:MAG TPA: S9 family peptidase [Ktedonobacteraceae bacterium]|nr:S9 family peptidase [Ktedonobacteraceae bacterium]
MTTLRKLTNDDLWSFDVMGNVALSSDGRRVAFVMQSKDKEKNEVRSNILLLHLDGQGHAIGTPKRLTSGGKNNTNPVWAPDNRRLLFLSDREGEKNQLWLIDTDGGEARKLTSMLHGVSDAAWSPDGRWIAFTAAAALHDDDEVVMGRKPLDEAARKKYDENERIRLRTITSIRYRLDGRGLFDRFHHLFVVPAPAPDSNDACDPATIRRLTSGDMDHMVPAWTPDSKEIGILCNRNESRYHTFVSDLWAIDPATGEARCLTEGTLEIMSYSWSPDGRSAVAVGSQKNELDGYRSPRLQLVTRHGNEGDRVLTLSPDFDQETFPVVGSFFGLFAPYRPQWSQDGQRLYFLATKRGCVHVYRMDVVWRTITQLTTEDSVTSFLALLPGEQGLLLAQEKPNCGHELYRLSLPAEGTGELERLTHHHARLMAAFAWGKTERIVYEGINGDEIDGWLIHPVGAREGVRYPLIVRIHGGPHSAFSVGRDPVSHYYATRGYAVFYCNPHGSTGEGEAFTRQVLGDWGGWDFQEIMRGVDECIARGVADPERLAVTGYSYGGYMSMFVIGHTDRFKAAVPMAGVSNLSSFVGTSDIGFWMVSESKGYPWDPERADYYRERSPLSSAANVTTPTLFLHPENDLRCPIEQSEQFYMTLKMMGKVPVEFIRVPGAWHVGTSKPGQRFAYWDTVLEWFGKYIEIRPEEYA